MDSPEDAEASDRSQQQGDRCPARDRRNRRRRHGGEQRRRADLEHEDGGVAERDLGDSRCPRAAEPAKQRDARRQGRLVLNCPDEE
jgi:hypothetical protein